MHGHRYLHYDVFTRHPLAGNQLAVFPEATGLDPALMQRIALEMAVDGVVKPGKATAHDGVVARALARVVSGGETDVTETVSERDLLALEREAFLGLIRTPATLDRMEHMLATGKPLRN